jgi:hypothetical protein
MTNYHSHEPSKLCAEGSARELGRLLTRSRDDGWDAQELQQLVNDFVEIAHRLPVRTYDLVGWIANDEHFNREAIAHFAKDNFGMARKSQKLRVAA